MDAVGLRTASGGSAASAGFRASRFHRTASFNHVQDRVDVVDGPPIETLRLLVGHGRRSGTATKERVECVLVERRRFLELGLQDLGRLRQRELRPRNSIARSTISGE